MYNIWTWHSWEWQWFFKLILNSDRNCLMLHLFWITEDGVSLDVLSSSSLKCIDAFCCLETFWDFITQSSSQVDNTCLLAMASSTLRPNGCVPVKRGGQGRQLYPGSVFSHLCTPLKTKQASGTSLHWNARGWNKGEQVSVITHWDFILLGFLFSFSTFQEPNSGFLTSSISWQWTPSPW